MSADEQVAAGDRHVLRQLTLDREVRLVGVRVFEVLADVQREWQYWSKAGELLIVEALAAKLILRSGGGARGKYPRWAERVSRGCSTHSSLEYLSGIEQRRWRRPALRCQDSLLLLRSVGNV